MSSQCHLAALYSRLQTSLHILRNMASCLSIPTCKRRWGGGCFTPNYHVRLTSWPCKHRCHRETIVSPRRYLTTPHSPTPLGNPIFKLGLELSLMENILINIKACIKMARSYCLISCLWGATAAPTCYSTPSTPEKCAGADCGACASDR